MKVGNYMDNEIQELYLEKIKKYNEKLKDSKISTIAICATIGISPLLVLCSFLNGEIINVKWFLDNLYLAGAPILGLILWIRMLADISGIEASIEEIKGFLAINGIVLDDTNSKSRSM